MSVNLPPQLNTCLQLTSEKVLGVDSSGRAMLCGSLDATSEDSAASELQHRSPSRPVPPPLCTGEGHEGAMSRTPAASNIFVHMASNTGAVHPCQPLGTGRDVAVPYSRVPPQDHGCNRRRWFCQWQSQNLPGGCGPPPRRPSRWPRGQTSAPSCRVKAGKNQVGMAQSRGRGVGGGSPMCWGSPWHGSCSPHSPLCFAVKSSPA